jgi:RimJ/RimL family protein N-acetyltransferase
MYTHSIQFVVAYNLIFYRSKRSEATVSTELQNKLRVMIRPLMEQDRQALHAFGLALPANDLLYLEDDYQSQEIITRLINAHVAENWRQVVAVDDEGQIAGYAAARRMPGWSHHVATLRLLVADSWRHAGLGTELARTILAAARELGAAKVVVEMAIEQKGAQYIFEQLGFVVEGTLRQHATGRDGQIHDLVVMSYFVG